MLKIAECCVNETKCGWKLTICGVNETIHERFRSVPTDYKPFAHESSTPTRCLGWRIDAVSSLMRPAQAFGAGCDRAAEPLNLTSPDYPPDLHKPSKAFTYYNY